MANIKSWLEDTEKKTGETIEAVVIGEHYNASWSCDRVKSGHEGVVLSRDAGLEILDQEYDNGYGRADCYPMYAWTKSRVYFIDEYDGATGLNSVPRHPIACDPSFSGE